ncbi:MAG: recombinase family protein [Streptosporangiales bacterium]
MLTERLARSVPDARAVGDELADRGVKLSLGGVVYDPNDPMDKMFFNVLATFAEFEADLPRGPYRARASSTWTTPALQRSHRTGEPRKEERAAEQILHGFRGTPWRSRSRRWRGCRLRWRWAR